MPTLAKNLKTQLRNERQTAITAFLENGKLDLLLKHLRQSVDIALTMVWKVL